MASRLLYAVPFLAAGAILLPLPREADVVAATPTEIQTIPPAALDALRDGRYLKASLLLREHITETKDTAAGTLLLAAQAEAGWGDWERVERLLSGRKWLDTVAEAHGWALLGQSQVAQEEWDRARASLERYLTTATRASDRDRGLAEVRRGIAARGADDPAAAAAAYDRAAALLPLAAPWIRVYATSATASAGDTAATARRIATLDADLRASRGWRYMVTAYREASDAAGALAAAERAASELSGSAQKAEAWEMAGELRLAAGDKAGAAQAFRRAIDLAPSGNAAVSAARNLTELPGLTTEDKLKIGRIYLRHGNVTRGEAGIQPYLAAGGGTAAEREGLRVDLGNGFFRAGRYKDAEKILLEVVANASSQSVAAEALYLAGRSQYRDGRVTLARQTFLKVSDRYPTTEAAVQAMYLSADLDQDDGEFERAADRFRKATAMSPAVEELGLAYMRLAGMAFEQKNYARAARDFDEYRTRFPSGRRYQQATYWSALANAKLGNDALARERLNDVWRNDPFSYYGMRAAESLGRSFWDAPLGASPDPVADAEAAVAAGLARLDLYREIGWNDAIRSEIDAVMRQFGGSRATRYALAEALNQRGYTVNGIGIGWDLRRSESGWNPRLLRIVYPFPYRSVIVEEARERSVDPFLAAGLIRQESMFSAGAISAAGAIGLMQVMPPTAKPLADALDIRRFRDDLLEQAEFNVHLGMIFLADQLKAFDGRLPVVLAAYNAGPHRITRWRDFPEFRDDELFAERIPFAETRDYVKIVQQNARMYEALYGTALAPAGPGS